MKVVVIGTGYVGLAVIALLAHGHEIVGVDVDAKKVEKLGRGESPISEPGLSELIQRGLAEGSLHFTTDLRAALQGADMCFVCVGTPSLPSGEADLSQVEAVYRSLRSVIANELLVVNKSTVPVGTARRLQQLLLGTPHRVAVVSNPEFLREGKAIHDFLKPDRMVIGAEEDWAKEKMLALYERFDCPKIVMSPESAELTKYAANGFLATKISFINEIANICEKAGADVRDVAHAIGLDPRIGPHFLRAGLGYGGSCFPKDTSALYQIAGSADHDFKMLRAVIEANNHQREQFVNKVIAAFGDVRGKSIAAWGLAFKDNTDDVRESAAIDILQQLIGLGANISVFDPLAMDNARRVLNGDVRFATDALDAARDADALLILTEWPSFRDVDMAALHSVLRTPRIFDGRNLLADLNLQDKGFAYVGVGLGKAV